MPLVRNAFSPGESEVIEVTRRYFGKMAEYFSIEKGRTELKQISEEDDPGGTRI